MAIYRRPGHIVYTGYDRPEVEVLDDAGTWCYGELRSWDRDPDDGTWSGIVTWSKSPGVNHVDRFTHPDQIRRVDAPVTGDT